MIATGELGNASCRAWPAEIGLAKGPVVFRWAQHRVAYNACMTETKLTR